MPQGILNSQRMYSGSNREPHPLGASVFSNATTPVKLTVQKNAHHVIINNSGSYSFAYTATGSIGQTITNGPHFVQAIIVKGNAAANGGGVRLDINPCAWNGSAGTGTGDVTFVYRGQ